MRLLVLLMLGCVAIVTNVPASTITYDTTQLGLNSSGQMVYEYTYSVSGLTLQNNQELDIYYGADVYGSLSHPVAPSSLQPLVLQPNNPPGTPGDFSLYSSADNTVVTGPLSIDFTLLDSASASPQPYQIWQFPANGNSPQPYVIASGETAPATVLTTPEPAVSSLIAVGVLLSGLGFAARRRSARLRC